MNGIFRAWGTILAGRRPAVSIEITRECPLTCPGCYAYEPEHLGGGVTLRELADRRGPELVAGILELVDRLRPVHVSLVGGEPLVRLAELEQVLPQLASRGIHTQVVTSGVRAIPEAWRRIPQLTVSVSIDGLQPEHDARRKPATYERILKSLSAWDTPAPGGDGSRSSDGSGVVVHCTITRQQSLRPGYVEEFIRTWSARPAVRKIWLSLYTPQVGDTSPERLTPEDRSRVIEEIRSIRLRYPKLDMREGVLDALLRPPATPDECIFARTTDCYSADLRTKVTPCQFGGTPDCSSCGCVASAGFAAVARHRLKGGLRVGALFEGSLAVGRVVERLRPAAR